MKEFRKISIEKIENALNACLKRVPFLEIDGFEQNGSYGEILIDAFAVVRIGDKRLRLVIEAKNNGQPRFARIAAFNLERALKGKTDEYGIFMAPYISLEAAKICLAEKIGYVDLAGNCRLSFGSVYIEQAGKPNPFAEKRDLRSLFSPKAARVLRVFLNDPKKPWRVQSLSKEADVSLGQVSNVKKLLEDREWLDQSDYGVRLKNPENLIFEWLEYNKPRKGVARNYYSLKNYLDLEYELARVCEGEGIDYALTGFSGAARYAPKVRYQQIAAYVSGDMDIIAKKLDLKEVSSGANVSLIAPIDKGILYGVRQIDEVWIVSPLQLYLDLSVMKNRGEEAAKAILDEVIKRSW